MTNEELVTAFYTAFRDKDYQTMQSLYADEATFSDPAFGTLDAREVKAMWQMLITRGKDMTLTFSDIVSRGNTVTATWVASYTFTATGNKVVNHVRAKFRIASGRIVFHEDSFSFYRWASQALGTPGRLLGWTPLLRNKVRTSARQQLDRFLAGTI